MTNVWTEDGANVASFEFDASFDIPHNSVNPAADQEKKFLVYDKILELLSEEPFHQ